MVGRLTKHEETFGLGLLQSPICMCFKVYFGKHQPLFSFCWCDRKRREHVGPSGMCRDRCINSAVADTRAKLVAANAAC